MQPRYFVLSSAGSTPWQITNWQATPFQVQFAVIDGGSTSFNIDITYEDPTGVYPSPNSSSPTAFSLLSSGSSSQLVSASSVAPFAGYRFTLNSSSGGKATFVTLQSGIG